MRRAKLLDRRAVLLMTANDGSTATRVPSHSANHRPLEYRLDGVRVVRIEGVYIAPSAVGYVAGSREAIRADVIRRLPERAREQFPGIGGVYVKPVPQGALPAYTFIVSLVCRQPVSDPASDFSSLVVCWLGDDIEASLPEMIEHEIRSVEWRRYAVDGSF